MGRSTFFTGQPVFAQLCKYLDRDEVLKISTESGGERYRKSFDAWTHLLSMLHAVVMRFDSLREIEAFALTFVNRMTHLRMGRVPKRSPRTWTMATFVFHKNGTTHRARIVSYVETKTSGRGLQRQNKSLDCTNSSA